MPVEELAELGLRVTVPAPLCMVIPPPPITKALLDPLFVMVVDPDVLRKVIELIVVEAPSKAVTGAEPTPALEKNASSAPAGAAPVVQLVPADHVPDVTVQVLLAARVAMFVKAMTTARTTSARLQRAQNTARNAYGEKRKFPGSWRR